MSSWSIFSASVSVPIPRPVNQVKQVNPTLFQIPPVFQLRMLRSRTLRSPLLPALIVAFLLHLTTHNSLGGDLSAHSPGPDGVVCWAGWPTACLDGGRSLEAKGATSVKGPPPSLGFGRISFLGCLFFLGRLFFFVVFDFLLRSDM